MTSETTKRPDDRTKLETAVSKVAKAYHELVRMIENSTGLGENDLAKAFNFLAVVHTESRTKAELSLRTALAANGGFSLDKEYAPSPVAPTVHPGDRPVQFQGRLVGQGKPKAPPEDDGVDFVDS